MGRTVPGRRLGWVVVLAGLAAGCAGARSGAGYVPPADADGGWRALVGAEEIRRVAGMDAAKLDEAFRYAEGSTRNGGLLVARRGWLVYERYFGRGHREATANLASIGKSFTSVAMGMLIEERPEFFPERLDQRVFTPPYLPPEAFPLSDPRKAEIRLGQLLAFSACIRGNEPGSVRGEPRRFDPPGPDGWQAMVDSVALGLVDIEHNGTATSARTLWCEPGGGYSYASSSIHIPSIILRTVTGQELGEYLSTRLMEPLGWGRWGFGYQQHPRVRHDPGAGGIVARPTDMLRFGHLLLNGGRWGGRQLVPEWYLRDATRASPYNPHHPYSLQFDVNTDGHLPEVPRDAFWKSGSGGHALYVVPSLELVIWKLGGRDGQYEASDTGLETHPAAARAADPRPAWRETVDAQSALRETLRLVLAAVVE